MIVDVVMINQSHALPYSRYGVRRQHVSCSKKAIDASAPPRLIGVCPRGVPAACSTPCSASNSTSARTTSGDGGRIAVGSGGW